MSIDTKEITFDVDLLETNLKVNDRVMHIHNEDIFVVAYIDYNEAKAVLSHSSLEGWLVIDLRNCDDDFVILTQKGSKDYD